MVIDVQCDRPKQRGAWLPLAGETRAGYVGLLLNSTFAFTPDGGGPHSYRFGEALAAGAIPVVPSHLLLPFEPELSWAECVFRVKNEDIVDLPQLLAMRLKEVHAMRAACARLFDEVIGTNDRPAFRRSVRLWVARLRAAGISTESGRVLNEALRAETDTVTEMSEASAVHEHTPAYIVARPRTSTSS